MNTNEIVLHPNHSTLTKVEYASTWTGWMAASAVGCAVFGGWWLCKQLPKAPAALAELPGEVKQAMDEQVDEALKHTKGNAGFVPAATTALDYQKFKFEN